MTPWWPKPLVRRKSIKITNPEPKQAERGNKKVEKISEDRLKELQGHVNKINQAQLQLGGLESQKHSLLHAVVNMQTELTEFQNKLEEEYGPVNINLEDGSYTEIEKEEVVENV